MTGEANVPQPSLDQADDLDDYVSQQSTDPNFRAAYEDAASRSQLLQELVARRRHQGLTQRDIAEIMCTTQSAISELEGGGTDPRLSTLQRYARAVTCRVVTYMLPYDLRASNWRSHVPAHTATHQSARTEDLRFALAARR